jgi:fatty acid synthase
MTTTDDARSITEPARHRAAPQPGSLAADLGAGTTPLALLFPGIDGQWPRALADALVGRPGLSAWVDAVVADLDRWAATPEVRSTGAFADGFARLVHTTAEAPISPLASTGSFNLVGNLITNLVCLQALEAEGLAPALDQPGTTASGHSAGLLAAWVAGTARDSDGRIPVSVAADAARVAAVMGLHASRHPWAVSDSTIAAALAADEEAHTPMVAISGPRTQRLSEVLGELAQRTGHGNDVVIGVVNSPTRHVLSGNPADLKLLHDSLAAVAQAEADRRAKGRLGGSPFRFAWEPLPSSVPFHHPALQSAAAAALEQIEALGLGLPTDSTLPVIDPATREQLRSEDVVEAIVNSILAVPHDWVAALTRAVPSGSVAVFVSPLGSLAAVSRSVLRGRGALVLDPAEKQERSALFSPGRAPAIPGTWESFAPTVVRDADGALRLANRHTRLTGRSPMILPGMTPSTAEAPIVVAAANGGHVAELAGGGQVNARIFNERVAELTETLDPGQEVVLNAMYLDPYLWGLHVGKERLVLKARAAGAPFNGVTISAGIPDKPEAVAILDDLTAAGLWLNAFKPGTVAQVGEVLAIAAETPHTLWIHLEGGAAGGHHSWEDLDELLLATYHQVREHDNVVLAVGGGIADPDRARSLLTGTWAHAYGAPTMPVDAVLLGTVTMATAEAAASQSVKHALAEAAGHSGWVGRGQVAGGTTSGRSGLDADIYFLDNSASRAARLLDSVAGDAEKVAEKRDQIIEALSHTAKPYFGDIEELTYVELLERFAELTAMGRHGRYEDGVWLDPTHRSRFVDLLQRAEARLSATDTGPIPTLFADPSSVDDPRAAVVGLVEAYPAASTAVLHPADVAHFLSVCRSPGKPVPFVPVIDADVRRWYQSDSLWQSHSDLFEADQVLIIPGPTAVSGISTVNEPVAHLLDRFEADVAQAIVDGQGRTDLPTAPFRRAAGFDGIAPDSSEAVLRAALTAPTWQWLGAARSNPLLRIGAAEEWQVDGDRATWGADTEDSAALVVDADGGLTLTMRWPDLGLPGDGSLSLPVGVTVQAGVVTFSVTEEGMETAGSALLRMFAAGTGSPTDPAALAAGHAATVGAVKPLPDRVMARLWPQVFSALAEAGLSPAIFDLVHLSHALVAVGTESADPQVSEPSVSRTDGGIVVDVRSTADSLAVHDRFFVRRSVVDQDLPAAGPADELDDVVSTPVLTLGTLVVTAPRRLETFATVSGDANPIHRSDVLARMVGLPGRIVHGMWTSAAASRAVVEAAGGEAERVTHWSMDFVAPVLPGEEVTFTLTRTGMRQGARVVSVEATTESAGTVARGTAVIAPPRTLYVFPGQGIQAQGMGMEGYSRSAAARAVWDEADKITRDRMGFSILEVVRDNPTTIEAVGTTYKHPAGVLHLTQFTQVAMATLASAQVAEMREAGVFDPNAAVAGHSVGEYNALAASSEVLPLPAVIELVFARGQGMHSLVPRDADGNSDYRLAVIRPHLAGLSHAQAEELVNAVSAETGQLCEIVNHNLRGKQYAVAGTVTALEVLTEHLGEGQPGRPPLLYVPGIDVPFHSSALLGGVDDFRWHLLDKLPEHIDADALVGRYVPNLYPVVFRLDREYLEGIVDVCGSSVIQERLDRWEDYSADRDGLARTVLIELLAWQFASPVRWIETFELVTSPTAVGGLDIQRVVEVGVGTAPTLANLAKGSLALPTHRGTRPRVLNVEVDADEVFELTTDPEPPAVVEPEPEVTEAAAPAAAAPVAAPAPAAAPSADVPDLPVDHATALAALLSLRTGVRPDQLGHDSIESLVDGASSRRNQVLMDLGKEFNVPAIDGAHEVPLPELTAKLAERSAGYRYPGPILSAAVDSALTGALGPVGGSVGGLGKRVTGHWGLGAGWVGRTALALALGTREGSSKRGGDLATLEAGSADALVDAAVQDAASQVGVTVAPPSAAAASGGTVDAAAVNELREQVEGLLADQASAVLTRLGRLPGADQDQADHREALAKLALLESEHGPASAVSPSFHARRHVMLASGSAWARADVDHLVQASLRAESGEGSDVDVEALLDQIVLHREADPRIADTLRYHRDRAAAAGYSVTVALIDRALSEDPHGVAVPELAKLGASLGDGPAADVVSAAADLAAAPGPFADQVALVTGASPGSIAWSSVAHLLRGGATVVVVTTSDTPSRIAAYRDLERRYAGPGAQLHVVRANLASFADIDALLDWLTTPTTETVGPVSREVKPALWPTLVLPFAAAPAGGELPDTREDAQFTLRLLLLGVQRLVGGLAERSASAGRGRFTVILPMSPNHGTFGGDGAYGDAKAALETMMNKWHSEGSRWGSQTGLISAEIGWVRGTGLMAANDKVAAYIESELGVVTYASEQMGALIAALGMPQFVDLAGNSPLRVDLSGGLGGRADLGKALATAVLELQARGVGDEEQDVDTIDALPNLPAELLRARAEVPAPTRESRAQIAAEDMIVMVGIAELGPWGTSSTRWQAELGALSASGVVELAWRTGRIEWDSAKGSWVDVASREAVAEAEVAERYRDEVEKSAGVRLLEHTAEIAAEGYTEFTEVFLDRPLTKHVGSEAEARALGAGAEGAIVVRSEDGWLLTLPAGAAIRVPRTRPLARSVGGQFPSGTNPTRHGLETGVAASMDPLAAWNVVITADALADAGVTPEELLGAVHPSLVGNTQGTGMGGMSSIHALYMGPAEGRTVANDVLQEALGNVVSAHVNQGLVGGYGPMVHPVAACATAAVSLEEAVDKIALGKAEIIIGGGWDDLSTEGINGFANMAATADNDQLIESGLAPSQHSRPGDRRRRGFVEAQGGGSFVICRGSVALALGLPVRAVVGYAASFGDGVHTSIPAPGLGALGAARGGEDSPLARALARLGLTAEDIAVVSKHDTSTEANDPNEAFIHAQIQQAMGRTTGAPLRVISQKSLTGHAKGGAAAWQMAGLCDVFATGVVPGNRNLVCVDPRVTPGALVVDYRPLVRHDQVRAALVTSLGFGHVSALVALAHPDVFVEAIPDDQRDAYLRRARARRVAGARAELAAMHGGEPVLARRTERRLGAGSTYEVRDREAAMLLDPAGALPDLTVPGGALTGKA